MVPRLEAPGLAALGLPELGVEVLTWTDDEDPYLLISDLAGGPTRIAVADSMPARARVRDPGRAARGDRSRWPVR